MHAFNNKNKTNIKGELTVNFLQLISLKNYLCMNMYLRMSNFFLIFRSTDLFKNIRKFTLKPRFSKVLTLT